MAGVVMNPRWTMRHPKARPEMLGYVPAFLDDADPRPAREQFNERYGHGGGWRPITGMSLDGDFLRSERYPNDPVYMLVAETRLRDEIILYFGRSYVVIVQPGGSYEVARMD